MIRYLWLILIASLIANAALTYALIHEHYPRAAYISFVGVDKYGRCATGQDFINYDPDSKAAITNTVKGIAAFEEIERVVLINKWTIKNDMSDPPEVKLIKRK